jgi:uracil-DNA glycosylase family 4
MAEVLIIGLAPGAHGANRTGRPFTGDGAGDVLYKALYKAGLSNRERVVDIHDGLVLSNVYITNAVKCAPPKNRPTGEEKKACLDWLSDEWGRLKNVRIVLAMGKDAFDSFLHLQKNMGIVKKLSDFHFQHGKEYKFAGTNIQLIATYHFSRYNMNTGVLTEEMVDAIFEKIQRVFKRD